MSQHFLKIADGIDVGPLRLALVRQPELFGIHSLRSDFYASPHSQMTDVWVRYNHIENLKDGHEAFNGPHESVWYPEADLIPDVFPIAFGLMQLVRGERLGGVLVTKIPPGGKIAPHSDKGWHAEYYDKYFVPIQSDPGAVFGFEDGVINATPGEAYWFRNDGLHWVENNSTRDRIALIVCIKSRKQEV
jgi:hypothetical protein